MMLGGGTAHWQRLVSRVDIKGWGECRMGQNAEKFRDGRRWPNLRQHPLGVISSSSNQLIPFVFSDEELAQV